MKRCFFSCILTVMCLSFIQAQTVFHTEDITHFYHAFDSVQTTNDRTKQIDFVQRIYLDQGGTGIEFALYNSLEGGKKATAENWLDFIQNSQQNLVRIRPYFDTLPAQKKIMEEKFAYFKQQYPDFEDGDVYFVIGMGMFGGRPENHNLFIGGEVVASNSPDWAVNIVLHEFVHTFQKLAAYPLLAHSLLEGSADFIAELINQKSMRETYPGGYIDFGYKNEKEIWKEFKKFIPSNEKGQFFDWLYGVKGRNINGTQMKDLGYFMGYAICKAYYENTLDKKRAIRDIIEMDLSTDEHARAFLLASGYVPKKDVNYVQNFQFQKITEKKKGVKQVQYGYKIEKEEVVFRFELPKSIEPNTVEYVTIAGNFNGWNPQDVNFKMSLIKDTIYEYRMPKSAFKEKYNEFKFVVNGENWQQIPEIAKNTESGNLTLILP